MRKSLTTLAVASLALPFAWACASDGSSGPSASAPGGSTRASAPAAATTAANTGPTAASGASGSGTSGPGAAGSTNSTPSASGSGTNTSTRTGGGSGGIPSLVNVNLQNVLNDLAVKLNIDRANVPINAQVPIQLAANVCGVSVNVQSISTGGQANCTAKAAPQDLAQVVQQQMAAGGSVGGGAQGGSTAATGGTPTSGTASGGASNTGATSSGAKP